MNSRRPAGTPAPIKRNPRGRKRDPRGLRENFTVRLLPEVRAYLLSTGRSGRLIENLVTAARDAGKVPE